MPEDFHNSPKLTQEQKDVREMRLKSALAMELPFTIVAAIVVGGFLGYLLDRWLHSSPWWTIAGGAFGFVSSMIEIARRFRPR